MNGGPHTIFKSYKSNKKFTKICPIWQPYLCNDLESSRSFQLPHSAKQKTSPRRKLWPWFLSVPCPSSLPLPALTQPRGHCAHTGWHLAPPPSSVSTSLKRCCLAPASWWSGVWKRRGQGFWWACCLGPTHPSPEGQLHTGGAPEGPLPPSARSSGSLIWRKNGSVCTYFALSTSAFPGKLPHKYKVSRSSYFVIKLHSIFIEL